MQRAYCRKCKRYIPTAHCSLHGAEHSVLVIPKSPSRTTHRSTEVLQAPRQTSASRQAHTSPPGEGLRLAFQKDQLSGTTRPIYHVQQQGTKSSGSSDPVLRRSTSKGETAEGLVLRFKRSERLLHWGIAIPFIMCWVTALILVILYNPNPLRPYRELFAALHRISGICLLVIPSFVMFKNRRDRKIHVFNIKEAWVWSRDDVKWLLLMGLASISRKIRLPDQGKFNAAEKVNFMFVMIAWPVLIVTGVMIWWLNMAWVAWLIHASVALMVTPTTLGHIYMATINPETRKGLQGMISGYVGRQWARHHYAIWFRRQFDLVPGNDKRSLRMSQDLEPTELKLSAAANRR